MSIKILSNLSYMSQSLVDKKNNPVSFGGNVIPIGTIPISADLTQFAKARERLTETTIGQLRAVDGILYSMLYDVKEFVEKSYVDKVLAQIMKKWSKNGVEASVIGDFNYFTGLSNLHSPRKRGVPIRQLIPKSSGEIPGDFRVIEGRKTFDVYLPESSDTGNAGYIVLAEGSIQPKKGFNLEVQRIVDLLLKNAKV